MGARMKKITCPKCNGDNTTAIIYGYPDDDLLKEAADGDIYLGGCCVSNDDPDKVCRDCQHRWITK